MPSVVMVSVIMQSVIMLSVIMLSALMLSVLMLNVIMPSVIMTLFKDSILYDIDKPKENNDGAMMLSITTSRITAFYIATLNIVI